MNEITMAQALSLVKYAESVSREERQVIRLTRLKKLVDYVRLHSPYFRESYKEIGDDFTLEDLPICSKRTLMAKFNDWVTNPDVNVSTVEEYLKDKENIGRLFLGKYTVLTTSGTSGVPLTMVRDAYHNTIHGAMVAVRLLRDLDPGIMNPKKYRIASVIAIDSFSSSFTSFERARNARPEFAQNMLAISIMTPVAEIVKILNNYKPDLLTGYPSVLAALAMEKLKGKLEIAPLAIACSAEQLTRETHKTLKQAFNCPVLNNYCSTEGGEAAMMCEYGNLHINDDWVIMEPVDDENRLVEKGSLSSAVLITNLAAYIQPIIRYRLEDRVRITDSPCKCGSNLPIMEIMGREGDTLCLCGKSIPSVVFQVLNYEIPGALQFQYAQTGPDNLELRVILMEGINPAEYKARIKVEVAKLFEENGCRDATFKISSEPPRNSARGGKLKTVCREWNND